LDEGFSLYREGFRKRYLAMLEAKSRTLSSMVAGSSNFPLARMAKAGNVADRRTHEVIEYRKSAVLGLMRVLTPEKGPIRTSDADAGTRIESKAHRLEVQQELMKAANKAIRANEKRGPEAQVMALVTLGLEKSVAQKLLQPDFAGRIGFPSYMITNNGAEIRRLKAREESVKEAASQPTRSEEGSSGVRLEDSPPENRVRLFFGGKPSPEVIASLKQNGFRWAPSLGCWSAYRNHHSLLFAKTFLGG
jgi:hypothetical protein